MSDGWYIHNENIYFAAHMPFWLSLPVPPPECPSWYSFLIVFTEESLLWLPSAGIRTARTPGMRRLKGIFPDSLAIHTVEENLTLLDCAVCGMG